MARFRRRRNRRSNPVVTFLFGVALFFGAFGVLFINEGRVDISKVARGSVETTAVSVDPANEGKLVAVTGLLQSDETLGDGELLLDGNYLQIERSAEMYAWDEDRKTDSDTNVTRYEYDKEWTSSPANSSGFNNPNGHYNPPMIYKSDDFTVQNASLGAFRVDTADLFFMEKEPLPLTNKMVLDGELVEEYLFIGSGTLSRPEIGDVRIKYAVFPNGETVTVFGEQRESQLRPFTGPKETLLYRAYVGDRESAIASMRTEFLRILWGFRAGGFVMMWIGLMTMVSPLTRLMGAVPLVGGLGQTAVAIVTFLVALLLSGITIIISAILNNIFALITVAILIVAVGVFFWQRRGEDKEKGAVLT